MKLLIKRIGLVLGGILILLSLVVGIIYGIGWSKINKVYSLPSETLTVPPEAASVERGRHLVETVSGCGGCHGADLSGDILFEVPALGRFPAPNLTAGQGGVGQTFTTADWVRALRHGVDLQGKTLMFMPSNHFYYYSDADLAAIIAYLQTVPRVDNVMPPRTMTVLTVLLVGMGQFNTELRAQAIDHTAPRPAAPPGANVMFAHGRAGTMEYPPPEGSTAEYGGYLVTVSGCAECHGEGLVGRRAEAAQNGPPAGPNLTRGGELIGWSQADFVKALRAGVKPSGTQLSDEMPWKQFGQMSDEEIQAIWLYLQSLPAQPTP